ncbi:DUF1003 domain-containing protein [Polaromonas sp. JS666]|uniref:DUF1003 domain-containing protein n=1 Tax=Polaromonas sp. (strain JS666 / ATCC BAA-500) TaxID=296591 RepID=UPI00088AB70D|nr:DUF1003 domain-containing protein [Polaromonas sp. JS666]SDN61755.1 Uncharacterized membrane protein [Polaromonas sp. JS666]
MHKQPADARHRARNARDTRADDLTRENVQSMRRVEETALANRSRADRMAAFIAGFCGSMPFVWLHAAAFAGWIALNTWPGLAHWDPYPFTFLTLVVSLEAIFLASFILISQNYELRVSDRRNQLDLQINLLTEQENTKMIQMLERIAKKVGADSGSDPDLRILKENTNPEKLVAQIEQAQHEDSPAAKAPKKS